MTAEENQKILDEINRLCTIYREKFGVNYGFSMQFTMTNEETLADLRDCIENNHLQVRKFIDLSNID